MKFFSSILLFLVLSLLFSDSCAFGQSAVAFCPQTNKVGYTYGAGDESTAKQQALEACKKEGGTAPYILISTNRKGYGCIYMGVGTEDGVVFIGAGLACASAEEAEELAMRQMKNRANQELDDIQKAGEFYDASTGNSEAKRLSTSPAAPAIVEWEKGPDEQAVFDYFKKEDYPKVIEHAAKALTYRTTKEIVMMYIFAYLKLEKWEEAKDVCKWVFDAGWSFDPIVYTYYGLSCFKLYQYDLAATGYSKAIEKGKKEPYIYRARAEAYYKLHNYILAKKDLDVFFQDPMDDDEAYTMRGVCKSNLSDQKGAFEDFDKAIQLGHSYPNAFEERAKLFLQVKKYKEAESDLKKVVEISPRNFYAWLSLGQTAMTLKRPKDAVEYLNKAVELKPTDGEVLTERGMAYKKLKMKIESEADFNKAVEYHPLLEGYVKELRKRK